MSRILLIATLIFQAYISTSQTSVDSLVQVKTEEYSLNQDYSSAKALAIAFAKARNHERSLFYFERSLTLATNRRDSSNAYNNSAAALNKLGDYEGSITNHRKAIDLRSDDPRLLSQSYRNISVPFTEINMVDSAIHYLDLSVNVYEADSTSMLHVANHKGMIYHQTEEYQKAYNSYYESYEYSNGDFDHMLTATRNLSVVSMYLDDQDKVAYWMNKSIDLMDAERRKSATAFERSTLEKLELENAVLNQTILNNKRRSWIIVLSIVTICLLSFWIYRERVSRQKKELLRRFGIILYNSKKIDQDAASSYIKKLGEDVLGISMLVADKGYNDDMNEVYQNLMALSRELANSDRVLKGEFSDIVQDLCAKLKRMYQVPHAFSLDDTDPKEPFFLYAIIESVLYSLPYAYGVSRVDMRFKGKGNRTLIFNVMSSVPEKIFVRDEIIALVQMNKGHLSLSHGDITTIQIEI